MPQRFQQDTSSRILGAWLILALVLAVMGGLATVYNPLPGAGLLLLALIAAWRAWRNRTPSPRPLSLTLDQDPFPGALGGEVGGWLRADSHAAPIGQATATLACIRLCERQRSQIIEHRRECLWQETRPVFAGASDQVLGFCFTPPGHLPATEPRPELSETDWNCHHYWTLTVEGIAGGQAAAQGFRLIIKPGVQTMGVPLSPEQQAANEPAAQEAPSALARLRQRLSLSVDDSGLTLEDPVRPASWATRAGMVGALLLVLLGALLDGAGAWLLLVVGLGLGAGYLFHQGQALHLELSGRNIRVITTWSGKPLFARQGQLAGRDQLVIRATLLSGRADLFLQDGKRRVLLARALPMDEAQALRDLLLERIMPE